MNRAPGSVAAVVGGKAGANPSFPLEHSRKPKTPRFLLARKREGRPPLQTQTSCCTETKLLLLLLLVYDLGNERQGSGWIMIVV